MRSEETFKLKCSKVIARIGKKKTRGGGGGGEKGVESGRGGRNTCRVMERKWIDECLLAMARVEIERERKDEIEMEETKRFEFRFRTESEREVE
jgi:hypothetical protein